jgi:hypothetical protein
MPERPHPTPSPIVFAKNSWLLSDALDVGILNLLASEGGLVKPRCRLRARFGRTEKMITKGNEGSKLVGFVIRRQRSTFLGLAMPLIIRPREYSKPDSKPINALYILVGRRR